MSLRASCFLAAVGLLLCLNLVSGWMAGPPGPTSYWRRAQFNAAAENSGDFNGRSTSGDELIMDADIMLTPSQYRRLYQGVRGRAAGRTAGTPWTDGVIPYEITPGVFTPEQLGWINRGMRNWESLTCVRFREAHGYDMNTVLIMKGGGCYASLGMQGGSQNCSLSDGCFYRGTVEHELGHTMGLIHEHQRPNRDDFLKINYFAVDPNKIFQINKYAAGSDDKLGLPYDYHSVMHYSKTTFANVRGTQTIYTRDTSKTDVIGMVMGPSFYDIKLINLMYKCKDRCSNPPPCAEPCFVNELCQCYCQSDAPQEVCEDYVQTCPQLAARELCEKEGFTMLHSCRQSCGVCKVDGSVPQLPCVDTGEACFPFVCGDPQLAKNCKRTCNICEDNSQQLRCMDSLHDCRQRAERGECESNAEVMLKQCTRSCDFCLHERLPRAGCEDDDSLCTFLKSENGCDRFPTKMSQFCKKSCNNCDNHVVVPASCVDRSPHCFAYAWDNKCPMIRHTCPRSCDQCVLNGGGACQNADEQLCRGLNAQSCLLSSIRKNCSKLCGLC